MKMVKFIPTTVPSSKSISPSRIKTFKECPLRLGFLKWMGFENQISKSEKGGEQSGFRQGKLVHALLAEDVDVYLHFDEEEIIAAKEILHKMRIPEEIFTIMNAEHKVFNEHKIALNFDLTLAEYTDNAFIRGIIDRVILGSNKTVIIDWKTSYNIDDPFYVFQIKTYISLLKKAVIYGENIVGYIIQVPSGKHIRITCEDFDIDEILSEYKETHEKINSFLDSHEWEATPDGIICSSCKASYICPAFNETRNDLIPAYEKKQQLVNVLQSGVISSHNDAHVSLQAFLWLGNVQKQVKKMLIDYLIKSNGGIEFEEGCLEKRESTTYNINFETLFKDLYQVKVPPHVIISELATTNGTKWKKFLKKHKDKYPDLHNIFIRNSSAKTSVRMSLVKKEKKEEIDITEGVENE